MTFSLPPLPFAPVDLSALSSAETFEFHHGRHHRKYVDQVNALARGTRFERAGSLEEIVLEASGGLLENASQAWNHDWFWRSLAPQSTSPRGDFGEAIRAAFGGTANLVRELKDAAAGQFGPGWVWLARERGGTLRVLTTAVAANPARDGLQPLLAVDLWEHAYYLDYRDDRAAFVERVAPHLNWAEAGLAFTEAASATDGRALSVGLTRPLEPRERAASPRPAAGPG